MQTIFAGIVFVGTVATIVFVKSLDLGAWLTIAIVVPLVFLVVYSLARISPRKPEGKKDTWK
jgi:hypothetical protein